MADIRPIIVNGYAYPNISPEVLEAWTPLLSYMLCFSYGITPEGGLIDLEDYRLRTAAQAGNAGSLMVLTPLNEEGQFSNELAAEVLRSPSASANLVEGILSTIQEKGMSGVDFDFEYVYADDRQAYVDLVAATAARLNPLGYIVTVALAPKTSALQEGALYSGHDYRGMGEAANYVFLMTYEWGYTYGPPMAVSPINKVREVLNYGISEIPPEKILMGVPNYGYDWTLPFVKGESMARKVSFDEAFSIAESFGAEILYDEVAQTPYYYYTDENGLEHVVWFDDERSLSAKLSLISDYGIAGASYWNIMTYFQGNSQALLSMYEVIKP